MIAERDWKSEDYMFIKNLLRRKIRTFLTVAGVAIGVTAIISLGAMADGLEVGYNSMLRGSGADLILSQPNAVDISFSSVDEEIGQQLAAAPEVAKVSGMIEGFVQAENEPFFFVFGYPEGSFILKRFQLVEGVDFSSSEAAAARGKPILLGSAASEILNKKIGDSLHITGNTFRVIGVYQTGDAFEDGGAVMRLSDAQDLLGKQRQVNLFYIRLKDNAAAEQLIERINRQLPGFSVSGLGEFAESQAMSKMLKVYVWVIGGLAILIGGVGMMNAQLMSVMERTREIGVLRAVGWTSRHVLWMILMESVFVCLLGGALGYALGYALISALAQATVTLGINAANISPDLILQAIIVVLLLGLVGGLYPAWRASRLQPVEALRYEGGSSGSRIRRLPFGGLAVQSLWQRSARTLLTLGAIGLTVGAIIAIEGTINGFAAEMTNMYASTGVEIMLRQADISDTSLSAIDERDAARIAALPEVESVSGIVFTGIMLPETGGFFILQGYSPNDFFIRRFRIIEGEPLTSNHQIILGKSMAETLNKKPGSTLDLSGYRYRVVGIFESSVGWEEMGGVVTLRDAQSFTGRPRKSTMYAVKLKDPSLAMSLVEQINRQIPGIHAALASDFVNQMPDMQHSDSMVSSISALAIVVGGVGVLNTMLMSVFERTREIGVLRALGWQRRRILGLILREALLLSLMGGIAGIILAWLLMLSFQHAPMIGGMLTPVWDFAILARAFAISLLLGIIGGIYPAFRATRLQPIEALRYE